MGQVSWVQAVVEFEQMQAGLGFVEVLLVRFECGVPRSRQRGCGLRIWL